MEIGYALSSEEHQPDALVDNARRAEQLGFSFALISDHFHPWTNRQGNSSFVWTVLGAIARQTDRLRVGTGVTCPTLRTHPAIIAHAAATVAAMMPGRFFLGLGSGERLNEHVLGDPWPPSHVRQEMLAEAIIVIKTLWSGEQIDHDGAFYTVENARLYTLPPEPPHIYLAASGEKTAELAGRLTDGFIGTSPKKETIEAFDQGGGKGKPRYGQLTVCWAPTEDEAVRTAHEWWPQTVLGGSLSVEIATPADFEAACETVRPEDVAQAMPCGPDPEKYLAAIREYADAGYDHVYLHQVGPDQDGFFSFFEREISPKL
ncbi:MAG TPA: TIGR03557 family F420-dependent LLM class oxidoreductase [Actinomycetota bacterium]|nr:TIGR03557 family F420-dependent LLM class oxidoreductase [Actinomycetota bacterium]